MKSVTMETESRHYEVSAVNSTGNPHVLLFVGETQQCEAFSPEEAEMLAHILMAMAAQARLVPKTGA